MIDLRTQRLLILGDDRETADIWAHGLRQRGLEVVVHGLARTTVASLVSTVYTYSLVMIDVNDSQTDVVEFCQLLRAEYSNPLLVFTYETDERLYLRIYEAGVDECIAKPIGTALILSKVQAWLRRAIVSGAINQVSTNHDFRVNFAQRRVTTPDGKIVRLSRLEFRLFHLLITNHGQILDAELIIDRVWGSDGGDSSQLKNLVYRLRQKIELDASNPRYIFNEPNHGYVLRT